MKNKDWILNNIQYTYWKKILALVIKNTLLHDITRSGKSTTLFDLLIVFYLIII